MKALLFATLATVSAFSIQAMAEDKIPDADGLKTAAIFSDLSCIYNNKLFSIGAIICPYENVRLTCVATTDDWKHAKFEPTDGACKPTDASGLTAR
ncbi:DUF1496 domain-containing protein [Mesorhizobium sp. AR02]|nr:DUF1496 domain-containing protein [Mesorhizobium sp. AR02]